MHLLVAVEMHGPDEEWTGLVLVHLLFHQQRIGAEIDELAARDDALDDLRQLAMQKRLAAGNRHDRGAAFIDGMQGIRHGDSLIEDFVGIIDLAAAGAGEIAAKERLEHQHKRIALAPGQMLANHVGPDKSLLPQWNTHANSLIS